MTEAIAVLADSPPSLEPRKAAPPELEERIRARAYEIFLTRASEVNDPTGDWLRAEAEIRDMKA